MYPYIQQECFPIDQKKIYPARVGVRVIVTHIQLPTTIFQSPTEITQRPLSTISLLSVADKLFSNIATQQNKLWVIFYILSFSFNFSNTR